MEENEFDIDALWIFSERLSWSGIFRIGLHGFILIRYETSVDDSLFY